MNFTDLAKKRCSIRSFIGQSHRAGKSFMQFWRQDALRPQARITSLSVRWLSSLRRDWKRSVKQCTMPMPTLPRPSSSPAPM